MIPYLGISQTKYKINGDTVIVFKPTEIRKLAIKLLEGEKYESMYLTNEEIIKLQDSIISFQSYHISIRDSLLVISVNNLNTVSHKLIDYKNRYEKERKRKRRNAWIAVSSIGLNVLLIYLISK